MVIVLNNPQIDIFTGLSMSSVKSSYLAKHDYHKTHSGLHV